MNTEGAKLQNNIDRPLSNKKPLKIAYKNVGSKVALSKNKMQPADINSLFQRNPCTLTPHCEYPINYKNVSCASPISKIECKEWTESPKYVEMKETVIYCMKRITSVKIEPTDERSIQLEDYICKKKEKKLCALGFISNESDKWSQYEVNTLPIISYPKNRDGKIPVCSDCKSLIETPNAYNSYPETKFEMNQNTILIVEVDSCKKCLYCFLSKDPRRYPVAGYTKHCPKLIENTKNCAHLYDLHQKCVIPMTLGGHLLVRPTMNTNASPEWGNDKLSADYVLIPNLPDESYEKANNEVYDVEDEYYPDEDYESEEKYTEDTKKESESNLDENPSPTTEQEIFKDTGEKKENEMEFVGCATCGRKKKKNKKKNCKRCIEKKSDKNVYVSGNYKIYGLNPDRGFYCIYDDPNKNTPCPKRFNGILKAEDTPFIGSKTLAGFGTGLALGAGAGLTTAALAGAYGYPGYYNPYYVPPYGPPYQNYYPVYVPRRRRFGPRRYWGGGGRGRGGRRFIGANSRNNIGGNIKYTITNNTNVNTTDNCQTKISTSVTIKKPCNYLYNDNSKNCTDVKWYIMKPLRFTCKPKKNPQCDMEHIKLSCYLDPCKQTKWKNENMWFYNGVNLKCMRPKETILKHAQFNCEIELPCPKNYKTMKLYEESCGERCVATDIHSGIRCIYQSDTNNSCPSCKKPHYCSDDHRKYVCDFAKKKCEDLVNFSSETMMYCPEKTMICLKV